MGLPKTLLSEAEYLEQERKAAYKSEFYKGEVFAMAGATKEHNAVVASLIVSIGSFLKAKGCRIFPSDMRVYNPASGLYTYPDISIVCGNEDYLDEEFDTLLNPVIVIEVLSKTTEDYDRGTKFTLYRSIPSLQQYLLVSSINRNADLFTRTKEGWLVTTTSGRDEHVELSAIDYNLKMEDIYAQAKLKED